MNILLQILDDGRLTDSQGRIIDFKNTVIIMTSNIGAKKITDKKTLGFGNDTENEEYENIRKDVMNEVKSFLKPEFMNRIDEIIVFHKLSEEDISKIVDIMLNEVVQKMKNKNIDIEIDNLAKELITRKGTNINFGARPLRRTIQNLIEDKLAEEILNGITAEKSKLKISAKEDGIIIY